MLEVSPPYIYQSTVDLRHYPFKAMPIHDVGFMLPWCCRMGKVLQHTASEVKVWRWGPDYESVIQFSVASPTALHMSVEQRKADLKVLREGTSLFAALARMDTEACATLVSAFIFGSKVEYCDHVVGTSVLPAFVELNLSKWRPALSDVAGVNEIITSMCCSLDLQNTSAEFRETWAQIERLSGALSTSAELLSGIEIPVRFVVDELDEEPGIAVLAQAWEVIRTVMDKSQIAWGWASSNPEKPLCCSQGARRGCFSSFVLDSISAQQTCSDDGFHPCEINANFIDLVGKMAGRVRFSDVTFPLLLLENEAAAVGRFSRMISRILCIDSCSDMIPQADCRMTNFVKVCYTTTRQFGAFCAALAVAQSCQSVHISSFSSKVDSTRAKAWQWLAYACFSKKARSHSAVRKIKLMGVNLTREDADAMAKIITSETPEHVLFSSDAQTGEAVPNDGEYHVDANTIVRLYAGESTSSTIFKAESTCGVRLVGAKDDGGNAWVDALVPGVGFCTLQRSSLSRCYSRNIRDRPNPLQLEMQMNHSWGGIPRLLELVGPSLQSLRLSSMWNSPWHNEPWDISWLLSSCPNLEDLTVKCQVLSAEAFVRSYVENRPRLTRLQAVFDDEKLIVNALKDKEHQLTKYLRCWYCYRYHLEVAPLQEVLDVNRSLRWLTIDTSIYDTCKSTDILMGYNGQQLDLEGDKLPTPSKLAFLSVFNSRTEPSAFKKHRAQTPLQAQITSLCRGFSSLQLRVQYAE